MLEVFETFGPCPRDSTYPGRVIHYCPSVERTQDEVNTAWGPGKPVTSCLVSRSSPAILFRQVHPSVSAYLLVRLGRAWTMWARISVACGCGWWCRPIGPRPPRHLAHQHAYDLTNFRFGRPTEKTGLNLALEGTNVFDVPRGFVLAATATPTAKYTNEPRPIGLE